MDDQTFPTLANFLETWFCSAFDFAELEAVIDQMKRLQAWENLDVLRHEAMALGDTPLDVFNAFSDQHSGRAFSTTRFEKFTQLLRAIEVEEY